MHALDTLIAKDLIALSVLVLIAVFFYTPRKYWKEFICTALLAAVLSYMLAKLGSHLFYDPRPFVKDGVVPFFTHANDNGFPSDHSLFAGFMAAVAFRYSKLGGAILAVLAVMIGSARVIGGVHHGIDVLGSFVFAIIGTLLAIWIVSRLLPRHEARHHRAAHHAAAVASEHNPDED